MDCQLGEIEKARLSTVVSKLVSEKRFDLNFFDPKEKSKVNLKKKKRRRNFTKKRNVKVTSTYVEQEEEIIPVATLDPEELEKMKEMTKEEDDIYYTIDFSNEQSILDNPVVSSLLVRSKDLLKYVKHDKVSNKFVLIPEICFENGLSYEENSFNILMLYLKFNINRILRSYNNTEIFSIRNNHVIVQKYVFKYILKHNFSHDLYHFKVVGDYDVLYPTIEDITFRNLSKIDYDDGIDIPFGNSYICFCKQKKTTQEVCKTCEYTSNLLHQLHDIDFCISRIDCNHNACKLGLKISDYLINLGFKFTSIRSSNHVALSNYDNHITDHVRFFKDKKYMEGFKSRKLLTSFADQHGGIIANSNTMLSEQLVETVIQQESFSKPDIEASSFTGVSPFARQKTVFK